MTVGEADTLESQRGARAERHASHGAKRTREGRVGDGASPAQQRLRRSSQPPKDFNTQAGAPAHQRARRLRKAAEAVPQARQTRMAREAAGDARCAFASPEPRWGGLRLRRSLGGEAFASLRASAEAPACAAEARGVDAIV